MRLYQTQVEFERSQHKYASAKVDFIETLKYMGPRVSFELLKLIINLFEIFEGFYIFGKFTRDMGNGQRVTKLT